jgi:UTP--glucose-1-phosphate uridylyltransferase
MNEVTKAVFPVAGLGTRFLPATKASPKEMMPIVDKPLIQYAVEEAIAAGITDMVFVTGRNKRAIEDHFDKNYELEAELNARGKHEMLQELRTLIPDNIKCTFIRQHDALGLGHAVLCAKHIVGDEPFAVILADDLIESDKPTIRQMLEVHRRTHCSVLAVQNVAREETRNYGVVQANSALENGYDCITAIVEKPRPEDAPSTLAVVGRYILTPRIFDYLPQVQNGAGGEIQLTDAIQCLLADEQVFAFRFDGIRYDCGSKLGYIEATLAYALKHPEIGNRLDPFLGRHGYVSTSGGPT